jgi:hypothetical protein
MSEYLHRAFLESLYTQRASEALGEQVDSYRAQAEIERRLLDVCKLLWRNWPLAVLAAKARIGDRLLIDIFEALPSVSAKAPDVLAGIRLLLLKTLKSHSECGLLVQLFKFDELSNGSAFSKYDQIWLALEENEMTECRVSRFDLRILELVALLKRYHAAGAPDCVIGALPVVRVPQSVAFFVRGGRFYARELPSLKNRSVA